MATSQKLATSGFCPDALAAARRRSGSLAHLCGMNTSLQSTDQSQHLFSAAVLTISELAAYLGVPVQTLYDLRHHGRGPRGFRVGRELRFRITEIEAWLAAMEEADAVRHHAGDADTGDAS